MIVEPFVSCETCKNNALLRGFCKWIGQFFMIVIVNILEIRNLCVCVCLQAKLEQLNYLETTIRYAFAYLTLILVL